ncbi:MAG: hypothetical protein EZS28_000600 [Streblomastix strix]|uniref:Uncharacterized protein n=1 Tax=Streblomastix strix TaxID=222440 RepID=A0A5J4XAP8_9EUKA|nr:MAG: hypothetical protein EZS28_000600 [Streblomastix strix]
MINQDSQRSYLQNDGAALMIAGHNGQLATALIPLSAILDFPPELQKKDKNGGKTKFFFPSVVTTMRLFPQIVKIAEDGQIVYLYGDRAFALTWNYISCQIMWSDLECTGIIHSLAPMRVVDEQPTLSFKQDQESIDGSDKQSQKGSQVSSKGDDTQLTQIPHPTIAWIDYVEQRLTFGTIDKRRIITRQIKDLSSLPLSIAHIPTMHAIAVLCREYSQYPYYQPKQEDNERQFFHESIPEKDFKGDPFIDIAADWFIESHTKHFKDFRPKRFPPYKFNVPKVNLCYSSQKTNFSFGYPSWLSPANVKMALKNRIDNYYNLNTEETTTQLYNYFSMIQNAIDESDKILHTYADLSTSPMTAIYNRMKILNISLTLQKRIRVIGGVQGIYGFPSTLVVLNGKAAFVFIVGSRLDDNEVTTLNKIYKLDSMKADLHNANQSKKQEVIKNNLKNINEQLKNPLQENNNEYIFFHKKSDQEKIQLPKASIMPLGFAQPRCRHSSVAGIQLKHRPQDLVRTASLFCHRSRLIAQAYSPTLIIDSAQLGINQFGIVGDLEILIYTMLPNPLYKKMKQKISSKIIRTVQYEGYEYLPMCLKVEGEEENELYAEDLDDEQQLSVEQQSRIIQSQITVSPKGALQNLPSIPSFAIFSRSGEIMRSALVTYDNIPIMDLFLIIHVLAMNDMNFGDIWSHGQQKAIQDYHNIETKTFRLSIVEQALREFISTGRIARQPPVPLYDYIPNIYGLRNGRFTTSQVVYAA